MAGKAKPHTSKAGRQYGKAAQVFIEHVASGGDAQTAVRLAGWKPANLSMYARQCRHRYREAIDAAVTVRMIAEKPAAYNIIVRLASEADTAAVRLAAAKYIIDTSLAAQAGAGETNKPEIPTAELIKLFCDKVGPEATALALAKLDISVPDWITAAIAKLKQTKPGIDPHIIPNQNQTESDKPTTEQPVN